MSDPTFAVTTPAQNGTHNIGPSEAGKLICLVDGTYDIGDSHVEPTIYVHNTASLLTGSDEQMAQAVRDAAYAVSNISSGQWKIDGQVQATSGANFFHAVADFSGLTAMDDPVTLHVFNRPWTASDVDPCPPRSIVTATSTALVKSAFSNQRAQAMSPRFVDVRPLGPPVIVPGGGSRPWLRYVLFSRNGIDGNRLMTPNGQNPLTENDIDIVVSQVCWRPRFKKEAVIGAADGLADTGHNEPGEHVPARKRPMRFPGENKFRLVLVQRPTEHGSLIPFNLTPSTFASPQRLNTLNDNVGIIIQHNSNIFDIYDQTIQGVIEVYVRRH